MLWTEVSVYLVLLGTLYSVSVYLESSAAMRGTNRRPLPLWVDKSLRLFFLFVAVYPLCVTYPWYSIPPVFLYVPTFIDGSEKSGSRATEYMKRAKIYKLIAWYFQLSSVATAGKLDPRKKYIVTIHPHGFLPVGTMVNLLTYHTNTQSEVLNGVILRPLAASFVFYIPVYRDWCLSGGVIDAARYNARNALDNGLSIALVPGGASEALLAGSPHNTLVLRRRRGFIRLALETGSTLVPTFSFGENDCYRQLATVFPWVRSVQAKFQKIFGLSLPIVTNIFPKRCKITTVFGKPIDVTKVENPSDAQVEDLLGRYIRELEELFNSKAPKYIEDPANRVLDIT